MDASAALARCEGCGCKGGPGYRGPDGRCVGWKRLNKVCGVPPTTRCTAEGPALLTNPGLGLSGAGSSAPVVSNRARTVNAGLGCLSTDAVASFRFCRTDEETCETVRRTLIESGACVRIGSGVEARIEASSFEWVRVRVPGVAQPLWVERALLLAR